LKRLLVKFVKYITHVLREYINNFVAVYLNDSIVFLKNVTRHDEHIWKIMKKPIKAEITLNIKKCKFYIIRVDNFRMVFSSEELKILKKWIQSRLAGANRPETSLRISRSN